MNTKVKRVYKALDFTAHQQLRSICDKIGYIPNIDWDKNIITGEYGYTHGSMNDLGYDEQRADVREIIFTPEFISVFWDYKKNWGFSKRFFQSELIDSLDDPVQYLYNLLENSTS